MRMFDTSMRLAEVPGFTRFSARATVSAFGSTITPLAVKLLVLQRLGGGTGAVELVSAARWLPYLLFGLPGGSALDRRRRLPLQLGCDVGSGLVLLAIPVLAYTGVLNLGWLLLAMLASGCCRWSTGFGPESFVPRLVPVSELLRPRTLGSIRAKPPPIRPVRRWAAVWCR